MPTFVEEIQSVAQGDDAELGRRLSERIETVGDAVGLLEEWTEASHETHSELSAKYETAKTLARDDVTEATSEEAAAALSPAELVSHPAVSDRTKRLLSEYSTKLYVFLDEERSYEGARGELLDEIGAELALYQRLSAELGDAAASVRDAQQAIARFAREESLGRANTTATDVLLESGVDEVEGGKVEDEKMEDSKREGDKMEDGKAEDRNAEDRSVEDGGR